jgi:hypothetical protein
MEQRTWIAPFMGGGNGVRVGWFAWILGVAAEIEVASSTTASFWFGKIGGVAVNFEAHVTCDVSNCGFRFGGTVVEQVGNGLGFSFGVGSGSQGSQSDQHGGIDCSSIVKESAHDFLDSSNGWGLFKRVRGVKGNGELLFGSI